MEEAELIEVENRFGELFAVLADDPALEDGEEDAPATIADLLWMENMIKRLVSIARERASEGR